MIGMSFEPLLGQRFGLGMWTEVAHEQDEIRWSIHFRFASVMD